MMTVLNSRLLRCMVAVFSNRLLRNEVLVENRLVRHWTMIHKLLTLALLLEHRMCLVI
jgi:hypothetical protein